MTRNTERAPCDARSVPASSPSPPEDYDEEGRYLYPGNVEEALPEGELAALVAIYLREVILARLDRARDTVHIDMPIYYQKGTRKLVAPDVMFIPGVPYSRRRKSYRLWETGIPPAVAFEILSEGGESEWKDRVRNPQLYARLGIPEYYLYDPESGTLEAYVLDRGKGRYRRAVAGSQGRYKCRALGLELGLDGEEIRFYENGQVLLPSLELQGEAERRATQAEGRATQAEGRATQAERRIAELEAELRRLTGRRPRPGAE